MSLLSFSGHVTDPGDVDHSHITDLFVMVIGETAQLYSTTRYDGILRQWNIDSGVLSISDTQPFFGGVVLGGAAIISLIAEGANASLLVGFTLRRMPHPGYLRRMPHAVRQRRMPLLEL